MNRKLVIVLTVVVGLVAASLAYALISGEGLPAPGVNDRSDSRAQNNAKPPGASTLPGVYADYSEEMLAAATGTKVLFFYASWCPQCRELDDSIKVNGVPDGVTILKVDYDASQDLRQKYGVTIQTTLVKLDKQGKLEQKYVAYDEPTIASVKNHLNL